MPDNLFTVKQASEAMGVSRQSIRSYTKAYARFFSTEATPDQGGERKFTRDDLKLIAYISTCTAMRETHEDIVKSLERGDLALFRATVPDAPPMPTETSTTSSESNMPLVPMAQLQAAQALILDAQAREKEAKDREKALQERIEQLQREMGKLEGELGAIKTRPRSFMARLLGL